MMTQTHLLIATSLLSNPQRPVRHNAAIIFGSFVPDVAVFTLFVWSKFVGIPERQLWREVYFSEPMLTYTAIANSLPLYLVIMLLGIVWLKLRVQTTATFQEFSCLSVAISSAIGLFALAAITHLAGDFPVHVHDAHPHFWPFTDWRFHSSISYWDDRHHGSVFSLFEAGVGVLLSVILFRRFTSKWVRGMTLLAIFSYIAVPLYFHFQVG